MTEKTAAEFVMKTLRDAGFEAFLVGGVVRDLVLGREPHDYDVTTNARPEQVAPLFAKTTPVGAAFGVVVVVVNEYETGTDNVLSSVQIQVATYRSDGKYTDGRRPDDVTYSASAEEDVKRRDFTMNGLLTDNPNAASWLSEAVTDYVGGKEDIKNRVIRCIGNPYDRFREDALRMLRAVRFTATLGFTIEPPTFAAISANVALIENVSRERIREELEKLVSGPYASLGLVQLVASGLFHAIFSKDFADGLRFPRTLRRFSTFAAVSAPKLGIAMLLADCDDNAAVDDTLQSLKFSTEDYKELLGAVTNQRNINDTAMSRHDADLKLLARVPGVLKYGVELVVQGNYLFDEASDEVDQIDGHLSRYAYLKTHDIYPIPFVSGKDLIAMGYEPSSMFTKVLRDVEYHQLNGDFDSVEQALKYAGGKAQDLTGIPPSVFYRTNDAE